MYVCMGGGGASIGGIPTIKGGLETPPTTSYRLGYNYALADLLAHYVYMYLG